MIIYFGLRKTVEFGVKRNTRRSKIFITTGSRIAPLDRSDIFNGLRVPQRHSIFVQAPSMHIWFPREMPLLRSWAWF